MQYHPDQQQQSQKSVQARLSKPWLRQRGIRRDYVLLSLRRWLHSGRTLPTKRVQHNWQGKEGCGAQYRLLGPTAVSLWRCRL